MPGIVTDVITLSVPAEPRYAAVARIVVGGLAARLDFPYETLDDLQLAVESVLAAEELAADTEITLDLSVEDESLTLWLGPLQAERARALASRDLAHSSSSGLDLGTVLEAVVDRSEVAERDGERWLRLEKAVPGPRRT